MNMGNTIAVGFSVAMESRDEGEFDGVGEEVC
jgi:hypothetical protein